MDNDFAIAKGRIDSLLDIYGDDSDRFARTLRKERIPHLSFSQVTTIEFCEYRYFLQYIKMEELDPIPDYFTKGRLMHDLIAESYEDLQKNSNNGRQPLEYRVAGKVFGDSKRHITNAYKLHRANLWDSIEIIGVEHPFVFTVDAELPPMVGVIDLILRQNGCYVLIDHKTGRNFYPSDELQVAIYAKYILSEFEGETCRLFYDHYRWVNNLDRIRKPAFQRTEVTADLRNWNTYLQRILTAYDIIKNLKEGMTPTRYGQCFRCPYRNHC